MTEEKTFNKFKHFIVCDNHCCGLHHISLEDNFIKKQKFRDAISKHFDHEYEKVCGCPNCEFIKEVLGL